MELLFVSRFAICWFLFKNKTIHIIHIFYTSSSSEHIIMIVSKLVSLTCDRCSVVSRMFNSDISITSESASLFTVSYTFVVLNTKPQPKNAHN